MGFLSQKRRQREAFCFPTQLKRNLKLVKLLRLDLANLTKMVLVNLLKLVSETKFSTVSTQVLISNLAVMNTFFYLRKTFWLSSINTQLFSCSSNPKNFSKSKEIASYG